MPVTAGIYYHIYQDQERLPVILLHGAGGTHLYWPSEIRRLLGFRMIGIDLPGHGKSPSRGWQSISEYAAEIVKWLEAAGVHSAVFVGHSMGSAIVLALALDYPAHVLGIGLVGAGARLRVASALLEASASPDTFDAAVARTISHSFSPQANPRLVELATQRMAETRPSVLHSDFLACNSFDVTGRLGEIGVPTLVICGEDDQMTPLRAARFLHENIPHSVLEVIPGAGHMVMLERPAEVAGVLSRFLGGIHFP